MIPKFAKNCYNGLKLDGDLMIYDIIIIGAGPAGLTSAIYSARAGMNIIVIEKDVYGGKINYANRVCNYPGFVSISGEDLAKKMYDCIESLGVPFEYDEVIDSHLKNNVKSIVLSSGKEYQSLSVIIATGLKTRNLKCPGESEFLGKGVSYCATCDGFFFKDKTSIVVGGGNSALEDSIYLSGICKNVIMIVRKDFLRGDKILQDKIQRTKNIKILFNSEIKEIVGSNKVEKVILQSGDEIPTDGIFIAIGQDPSNESFSEISSNKLGYFEANEDCLSNIDGVYVAGDCRNKSLRQIVTATSDGAISANNAVKFVKKIKHKFVSVEKNV